LADLFQKEMVAVLMAGCDRQLDLTAQPLWKKFLINYSYFV
jgi:hypothetical protein